MRLVFGATGDFQVKTDERIEHDPASAWAAVMLSGPNGEIEHTAAEGFALLDRMEAAEDAKREGK